MRQLSGKARHKHIFIALLALIVIVVEAQQQFVLLANSATDFNGTQGANSWSYQYRSSAGGTFQNMESYTSQVRKLFSSCKHFSENRAVQLSTLKIFSIGLCWNNRMDTQYRIMLYSFKQSLTPKRHGFLLYDYTLL